uniref:Uncharacterized protein n=1 Tax=Candidatus Kentrum sp. SD TaxID=2126332 RepID=A0A451BPJ5_9GAMM|nr:MAG: hypothetical protein BECKSD772D_GA0070982_10937 [Candidatus Kentron sp. SD]
MIFSESLLEPPNDHVEVPITLENETTTPVGQVELRVTRQKCIKNVGLRR